jgi:hypothetical protein
MLVECDPKSCPTGARCGNQRFQKRQYAKVKEFKTINQRGFGLQATGAVADGDFVIEYCGEVVTAEECQRRMDGDGRLGQAAFYMLALGPDEIIDARYTRAARAFSPPTHLCLGRRTGIT